MPLPGMMIITAVVMEVRLAIIVLLCSTSEQKFLCDNDSLVPHEDSKGSWRCCKLTICSPGTIPDVDGCTDEIATILCKPCSANGFQPSYIMSNIDIHACHSMTSCDRSRGLTVSVEGSRVSDRKCKCLPGFQNYDYDSTLDTSDELGVMPCLDRQCNERHELLQDGTSRPCPKGIITFSSEETSTGTSKEQVPQLSVSKEMLERMIYSVVAIGLVTAAATLTIYCIRKRNSSTGTRQVNRPTKYQLTETIV